MTKWKHSVLGIVLLTVVPWVAVAENRVYLQSGVIQQRLQDARELRVLLSNERDQRAPAIVHRS